MIETSKEVVIQLKMKPQNNRPDRLNRRIFKILVSKDACDRKRSLGHEGRAHWEPLPSGGINTVLGCPSGYPREGFSKEMEAVQALVLTACLIMRSSSHTQPPAMTCSATRSSTEPCQCQCHAPGPQNCAPFTWRLSSS